MFSKRKALRGRGVRKETSVLRHVLYGILSISAVVLAGVSLWHLTRLPKVTINDLIIEGGETIDHSTVRSLVEQELRGTYYLLIPRRFAYTYPHDEILESLNSISRIHEIDIKRTRRTELTITFNEYIPYALWCLSDMQESECYFIDAHGYAFAKAPPLRGGAFTRYIVEGEETLETKNIIPEEKLLKAKELTDALESELDMRVAKIMYTQDGDVIYHINGGGDLLTAGNMNIDETFQNLQSILDSDEFSHLAPGNFNYIDLRFGNKVFVNEELETGTTTEEKEPPEAAPVIGVE